MLIRGHSLSAPVVPLGTYEQAQAGGWKPIGHVISTKRVGPTLKDFSVLIFQAGIFMFALQWIHALAV